MNPARWKQINELFHAALERDPAAREAFLRSAAGDDDEIEQARQPRGALRPEGRGVVVHR